jgi:preprotein translocase subunit SecA
VRILLISLLLISCNPVKQVLRDREKFDEVAKVVVASGYCANDTIIQTKSDTLITYDTFYQRGSDIIRDLFHTDTLRIPLTKKIVKTIRIRDTINSVVVDNARIKLLEAKLATQTEKTEEYKAKANSRLKWLILLIIAILVRIFYKPLKNLLLWHFLPMHK